LGVSTNKISLSRKRKKRVKKKGNWLEKKGDRPGRKEGGKQSRADLACKEGARLSKVYRDRKLKKVKEEGRAKELL